MPRIVVASSDDARRRDLRTALESELHRVSEAASGEEAEEAVRFEYADLLILDANLEGCDLFGFCRGLRQESDLGIITLISAGSDQCRIDALNAGADDYLPEHYEFGELLARVRAILRRVRRPDEPHEHIFLDDRAIDLRAHKVQGPGSQIANLTPKEFLVLKCLVTRGGDAVTNRQLAQRVWQRDGTGDVEYVRVVIGQLRRKLEPDHNRPKYILTERAVGYRFRVPLPPAHQYRSDSQAMAQ